MKVDEIKVIITVVEHVERFVKLFSLPIFTVCGISEGHSEFSALISVAIIFGISSLYRTRVVSQRCK